MDRGKVTELIIRAHPTAHRVDANWVTWSPGRSGQALEAGEAALGLDLRASPTGKERGASRQKEQLVQAREVCHLEEHGEVGHSRILSCVVRKMKLERPVEARS